MRFALTCLLLLLSVLPAAALDLPLRKSVDVGGEQVTLRDLLAPADATRLDHLAGPIELFRAPEPGMKRKVSRQTLARLVSRRIDPAQLHLTGAENVTIARKGTWIEPEEMEAALNRYLAAAAAKLPGVELEFEKLYLPPHFMVATGHIEHQVIPADPQVIGSRRMTLITRVDGEVVANQSIGVVLKARARVAVMAADMRRGETLASADLVLQQREISHLAEPFFSLDELLGKRLRQAVRLGQPLQRRQVEFPPLIRRGSRVIIRAQNHGLLLTASGEARQDGELGDTIRVRNNGSQREVLCRVLAAGLVSVEF